VEMARAMQPRRPATASRIAACRSPSRPIAWTAAIMTATG
jgi:hypothetical protein